MPTKQSVQQFGEQFLVVIQDINRRKQEQEEFNRTMQFQKRQLNLLGGIRRDQEERLQNQLDFNISQGFLPVQEGMGITGRQNIRTGEFETHLPTTTGKEIKGLFGADIGEGKFIRKDLIPEAPDFTGDRYETVETNVKDNVAFRIKS